MLGLSKKRGLSRAYEAMKCAHLGHWADQIPKEYWSQFVCVGGAAEYSFILKRMIQRYKQHRLRILVVGVFGGRDFWSLRMEGHDVIGFDLTEVRGCSPTVAGDAQATWPFPADHFDVIVMGEILEHLVEDFFALSEARRVLRPDGILVGTVPYLHDSVEYHVRVHTPSSIRRLLRAAGFDVKEYLERPGAVNLAPLNYINHLLALTYFALTGRSLYGPMIRAYGKLEWNLGRSRLIPRNFLRSLGISSWGGIFLAGISESPTNLVELNRSSFCNSGAD